MSAREDQQQPSWCCGRCGLDDLACVNRERMDGFRCCKLCDGHGIPVTEKGREYLRAAGREGGDGITLLQLMISFEQAMSRDA